MSIVLDLLAHTAIPDSLLSIMNPIDNESDPNPPSFASEHGFMVGFKLDATDHVADVIYSEKQPSEEPAPQTDDGLIGRQFWDFIHGKELRHLYEMIFTNARNNKKEIVVPYRCDSPTLQRFMELRVFAESENTLLVLNYLITEEHTAYTGLLDVIERDPTSWLSICSWCKKVKVDREWVEIQIAITELGLLANELLPQLTHGICPTCITIINDSMTVDDPNVSI